MRGEREKGSDLRGERGRQGEDQEITIFRAGLPQIAGEMKMDLCPVNPLHVVVTSLSPTHKLINTQATGRMLETVRPILPPSTETPAGHLELV
ncbi:hypothetical protein NQZ68_034680 [Dissostichus eleginoides]|nr:hypothetical protein NQZ68_034680 [Dissostichus eleginoides]